MHRNHRLLPNLKSGLLLSCMGTMALGAGPLNQTQRVDVQEIVPIELAIDWSAADGATAMQAVQPIEMTEAMILAETAQHEIGIALKNGRVSVLVHFEQTFARGAANPRVAVRALAVQRLGVVKYEYGAVLPNVINLRNMPVSAIAELENMPGVLRVEMDEYHPNLVRLHDATALVNGLQSQIASAGFSADGAGIRVCIADTGIDIDHVMYASRIDSAAGFDFANNDSNPDDDNGHGSHVAGIAVGGSGLNVDFGCGAGAQAFQGMAPQATLIGVKILNAAGGGFDSDIIAGINHCADQSPSGGRADVINLSIGSGNFTSGSCTHSWAVASNNAVANGVVVVAASGNENRTNSMGSPACGVNVIAVGAVYKADYPTCEDNTTNWNWGSCTDNSPVQDQIVCFSNESDFLDVAAPGANIWSASNAAGGGNIAGKSGTSMASPMVAGLAALILSADPSLTPAEVRQIIRDGAIDLGPAGFDRAYGFGRIDVINSLALVSGGGCSIDADCDDGVFCNGNETCVASTCQAGTAVNCNDGVGCTDDSCNEGTNSCDNAANNGNCTDGLFCNGVETCDAVFDCQAGSAVNCNDGVGCTSDSCNEGTNSCDNTPNNASCDDGVFCNGSETCNATLDCQAGSAVNCNDGIGCTADSCNEGTNSCDNMANNAACDDGLFCNGSETCSTTLDCQAGTTVNCNDGVGCTVDTCNETTNSCDNTPSNAACDDGLFCNGSETCDAVFDCQAGTDPCPGQPCNEGTQTCTSGGCTTNAECDDGNACTTDICSGSVCTNDCPSSVSSFPYAENFDAGLGQWSNIGGDVFDWTRRSGSTPSSSTGPSGDHTSGSGFYMYTETSSPRVSGDTAILEGPCFDLSGASSATLTFWYNMFGSTMGTLQVEVSTDCTTWTNVFSLSGNQGTSWFETTIDLTPEAGSSSVNIRFRGIRGSSWRGDSAIDDIGITMVTAANCSTNADCDDGNACTDDACVASVCQNTNNTSTCDDGLFCNGTDVCQGGVCTPVTNPGVANGAFDGSGSWTSNLSGGSISYPGNLSVVGADAGSAAFTWAGQGNVVLNGANIEFDLNSYSSSDTGGWDYPVFHADGTFYGLNLNGTLGAATAGGNGNGGTVDNAGQVGIPIHYIVNVDALTGNGGPHTIGFGVHTADGGFGAGTAVFDTVLPAGGAIDPCPGQSCDEVGDVCVP